MVLPFLPSPRNVATRTVLQVKGVGRQPQRGATVVTFEAAAMEELALSAQTLHHIDPPMAEVADIAASYVLWKLLPQGALWIGGGTALEETTWVSRARKTDSTLFGSGME